MDRTIGFLTIGQAPRTDIVPTILAAMERTRALEAGALNGLDEQMIAALSPNGDDVPLVTCANGSEVVVGKKAVTPRLQALIDRMQDEVDAFVILCTGGFPPFQTRKPVLLPDRLMRGAVTALWSEGTLGVVAPIERQVALNKAFWADYPVEIAVASPYGDVQSIDAAGDHLRRHGASLVVMNCMGFTQAMKQRLHLATGVPVLLPATVTGHMIGACL